MGFETMGMPMEEKKSKAEEPAFPELVDRVEDAWNHASAGLGHDETAKVAAERLNQNEEFRFARRQRGLSESITAEEVLTTRENFFKP